MGLSRPVIVLGVIAAALAAWLFFVELPGDEERLRRQDDEFWLMDFDPARVDTLRVEREGDAWVLARVGRDDAQGREPGWWLLEPIVEHAEDRYVENTLNLLLEARAVRRLAGGIADDAWPRYGLSGGHPSRASIVVVLDDGARDVLHVGSTDATDEYVYVRRDDEPVLAVAWKEIGDLAWSSHHAFRHVRVFQIEPGAFASLVVSGPGGEWQAWRDPDTGLWWSEIDGSTERVQRWQLDELAYFVANVNVASYQRDGIEGMAWAAYGLDRPWASVTWTSYASESERLDFGNEADADTYFARRTGLDTVFTVTWGFDAAFEAGIAAWIDRNPLPRNVRRAASIRIEDADGRWVEQRRTGDEGRDWIVVTEAGSREQLSGYLYTSARNVGLGIERMQADATMLIPRAASSEPGERGPTVRLHWDDGDDVVFTLWRRSEDASVWLQLGDEPTLHRVGVDILLRLRAMVDAAHAEV